MSIITVIQEQPEPQRGQYVVKFYDPEEDRVWWQSPLVSREVAFRWAGKLCHVVDQIGEDRLKGHCFAHIQHRDESPYLCLSYIGSEPEIPSPEEAMAEALRLTIDWAHNKPGPGFEHAWQLVSHLNGCFLRDTFVSNELCSTAYFAPVRAKRIYRHLANLIEAAPKIRTLLAQREGEYIVDVVRGIANEVGVPADYVGLIYARMYDL